MKEYNKLIDVIIPAYNVPDHILFRCLSSIACQSIVDEIEITIVDDASTEQNYANVIKHFENIMKINLLRYEVNGGPGVARQYGIDHTSNGYLTFIDADDTFNGAFALKALRNAIQSIDGLYQMAVGSFQETKFENDKEVLGPVYINHVNDMTWMFGKLYKREFLDKHNIRFHETSRANEDSGFNAICRLSLEPGEEILFFQEVVYYWHENPNSITRINDCQYNFDCTPDRGGFYGFVQNMIYAIQTIEKTKGDYDAILAEQALSIMLTLYKYYLDGCNDEKGKKVINDVFKTCQWFYNEIFKKYKSNGKISDELMISLHNNAMKELYDNLTYIPHISFNEFLNQLENN